MPAQSQYPLPVFHFRVEWGGTRIGFSEVTGLTQEIQAIEYRDGSFPEYSSIKMPGLRKYSNITLKRGVIKADNDFFKWLATVKLNVIERRDLTISLLNENHDPVMVWKVLSAFPVKIEGPQLKAAGNEVAIESIELAHLIKMRDYFATELAALQPMVEGGLVEVTDDAIQVTATGWFFVRGVAMTFDKHLQADKVRERFSRII